MVLNYQISSPETMERAICELGIVPVDVILVEEFVTERIDGESFAQVV